MLWIGIDPGKSGAWAAIDQDGGYLSSGLCPDSVHGMADDLWQQVISRAASRAVLEQVHAMPGQGVTSMFTFGMNYGMWQGILAANGMSYVLVTPQKWMKTVLDSHKKGEKLHLSFARRRWPDAPLARKKDEAVAAALCIAEYGRLMEHKEIDK